MSYTFLKRNVFNLDLKRLTSEEARISKGSLFHSGGGSNGKRSLAISVTNLGKYYPMLRKTAFRASFVVCVATVSVRIRSEEQGTLSQRPLFGSRSIFREANTENPVPRRSVVSLCSETTRKHLPHRLANH